MEATGSNTSKCLNNQQAELIYLDRIINETISVFGEEPIASLLTTQA